MGLFKSTPEELAAKERKVAEERARQAAEAFARSPAGQARAAKAANRTIFQTEMALSQTQGTTFMDLSSHSNSSAAFDYGAIIESIEAEGWRLEHVGYVYRVIGSSSRDRHLSSGQNEVVSGQIVGIYLFRAVEADASINPAL